MTSSTPRLARFAWAVLAYNVLVIVWGAFVRATRSGAGCGAHWPLCNGEIIPPSPTLATIIEFTHRITSGAAVLLAVALYFAARKSTPVGSAIRRAAAWVVFFELTEGAVGASIVLLRYVGDDASAARAVWIAAHLTNTFFLLVALVVAALRASGVEPSTEASATRKRMVGAAIALSIIVGIAGAITALGDTLFPATSLASGMQADASATAHFLIRLRILHPILATLTALVLAGIAGTATLGAPSPTLKRAAIAVVVTQLAQIGCGVLNLVLLAPVAMQMLHLLFADFAWIALIVFCDRFLAEPVRTSAASVPLSTPA